MILSSLSLSGKRFNRVRSPSAWDSTQAWRSKSGERAKLAAAAKTLRVKADIAHSAVKVVEAAEP